ncbi:sugar ABC transporter substrate-binding protein [Demequina pelophila]|uniref:sugar ABC transporter substrate-binding protein n=1 Tax=Demequina pelophila TaxID=1638984 RepID=UPI000781010A|nr:substrate-binding domain-containing protein [Demequina pelophila]
MIITRKLGAVAAFAAAAFVMTACSSGDSDDGGATAAAEEAAETTETSDAMESEGTDDGAMESDYSEALQMAFDGIGSTLDDLEPVTAESGLSLYVVSCGEQVPGCAVPAAAVKEAAETAGWSSTIADGKLNPEGFATAIRQAVAGGADIIVPIGIGCAVAQAAFQEAVDAGITVIGGGGVDDCDPKLWGSERLWLEDYTPIEQWEAFGAMQAAYATGATDGDVKAVVLNFTTQVWGQWITDGFTKELEELGGGEVVEVVDISDPETADGSYIQKATTALLNHPDANVLIAPVDGWFTNGLSAAIVQAGVDDQYTVIGRGGDEPALALIKQGDAGLDATVGFAVQWGAWGSVDTAARILAGMEPVYIGESIQVIDADHNMPSEGLYTGSVDYQALFKEAWGVS